MSHPVKLNATMVGIGRRLKQMRTSQGLSMKDLADRAGVTFQSISAWELGEAHIKAAYLMKVAAALGVALDEFIPTDFGL